MRFLLAVGVVVAFVVTAAVGCGGTGNCSAATCIGCCTSAGVCQAGNSAAACGASGNLCDSCVGSQTCTGGVCSTNGTGGGSGGGGGTQTCSSANCTGCCFNNACQSGNTAAACPTNQICKTDQTCGVDPDATFKVVPVSAVIKSKRPADNAGWDSETDNSPPDTVVWLACPSTSSTYTLTTPKAADTFTPMWSAGSLTGCAMKARDLLNMNIGFAVAADDYDITTNDHILGATRFYLLEEHFVMGTAVVQNLGGFDSLTFSITRQ